MTQFVASVITSLIGAGHDRNSEITHPIEKKKIRDEYIKNNSKYNDKIRFVNSTLLSPSSNGVAIVHFYPLVIHYDSKHQSRGGTPNSITMYHDKYESLPSQTNVDVNAMRNNFTNLISNVVKPNELHMASVQMIDRAKTFYNDNIIRGIMYFLNIKNKFDLIRQMFFDSDDTYVFVYGLRTLNDNKLVLDKEVILLFDADISKTITLTFSNKKPSYVEDQDNCVLYCIIHSQLQYNVIFDNNRRNRFDMDVNHLKSVDLRKKNRRSASIISNYTRRRRKRSVEDYYSNSEEEEGEEYRSTRRRQRRTRSRSPTNHKKRSSSPNNNSSSPPPPPPPHPPPHSSLPYRRNNVN